MFYAVLLVSPVTLPNYTRRYSHNNIPMSQQRNDRYGNQRRRRETFDFFFEKCKAPGVKGLIIFLWKKHFHKYIVIDYHTKASLKSHSFHLFFAIFFLTFLLTSLWHLASLIYRVSEKVMNQVSEM